MMSQDMGGSVDSRNRVVSQNPTYFRVGIAHVTFCLVVRRERSSCGGRIGSTIPGVFASDDGDLRSGE